jgi:hypothetical protein
VEVICPQTRPRRCLPKWWGNPTNALLTPLCDCMLYSQNLISSFVAPAGADPPVEKKARVEPAGKLKPAPAKKAAALPKAATALDSFGFSRSVKLKSGLFHRVEPGTEQPAKPQHCCPECGIACLTPGRLASHRSSHRSDHAVISTVSVAEFWKLRVLEEQRFDPVAFGDDEADVEDADVDDDGDAVMERKEQPKRLRKKKGGVDGRSTNKGVKNRKQFTYSFKAAVIDAYDHAVAEGTLNAQKVVVDTTGVDQTNVSKWSKSPQRVRTGLYCLLSDVVLNYAGGDSGAGCQCSLGQAPAYAALEAALCRC